jgi:hypothetical protein
MGNCFKSTLTDWEYSGGQNNARAETNKKDKKQAIFFLTFLILDIYY